MRLRCGSPAIVLVTLATTIILLGTSALPSSAQIQPTLPTGTVAFLGSDPAGTTAVYVLDMASGRTAQVDAPASESTELAWRPDGQTLAFTLEDGSYGLLRSLRGCFDEDLMCADLIEVVPPFLVSDLAWKSDGKWLYLQSDAGLKLAPPRLRPRTTRDLELQCTAGIATSPTDDYVLCATSASGNVEPTVYQTTASGEVEHLYDIGLFPDVTVFDLGLDGQSIVGTVESAGVSGFYIAPDGAAVRVANYQIFIYDVEFAPDGTLIAIAGATADATGDGSLSDGDPGELFLYDPSTGSLSQISGFTGATAVTWSPDGEAILIVVDQQQFKLYYPAFEQSAPVPVLLPAGLSITKPDWASIETTLPIAPTSAPFLSPTSIPTPTRPAIPTPFPTFTPYPTLTPYPTFTPFPTATPGSPIGVGCQYAYAGGGGLPVAIGDTAEVTPYGAAVRFRTGAALDAPMIRELMPGTRLTILSGPYCSQGYRWWEARLQADGRTGYLADSDQAGYWIKTVAIAPPAETISFFADRYSITAGECVTIQWDVEGIKEVYYQGLGVTGHESRIECPPTTSTYSLRVVCLDDSEVLQQITILVSPP